MQLGHPDALASCAIADFVFLQRITGLTTGNLSAHLTKLSDGGLVAIEKRFVGKNPNTRVILRAEGRRAVKEHWRQLEQLRAGARGLKTALAQAGTPTSFRVP